MVSPGVTAPTTWWTRWSGVALVVLWGAIGVGALLLLAEECAELWRVRRLQPLILLLNLVGVIALSTLIARKLLQLVRDYRDHVPGSRLTARTVTIFGMLVIVPLIIVYLFSLEFLNRGIDSWFRVEVKQGLNDALNLSRKALEMGQRANTPQRTVKLAGELSSVPPDDLARTIDGERSSDQRTRDGGVRRSRAHLCVEHRESVAVAALASDRRSRQAGDGRAAYVSLEPQDDGRYLIRTAAPI